MNKIIKPVPVLLDTDIGSDPDDAAALAYLLSQPNCDLKGITTVTGQPEIRAMLASVMCKAAGKKIPIYPGYDRPLAGESRQTNVAQISVLDKWAHEQEFPQQKATDFMYEVICQNSGKVVLLAIGPLTNVANLFIEHPDAAPKLKTLVSMSGLFLNKVGDQKAEWNVICDPYAADIVYSAMLLKQIIVSLDVTTQLSMTKKEVEKFQTIKILRPVFDCAQVWFYVGKPTDIMSFHDPLAASCIFIPSLCQFKKSGVKLNKKTGETSFAGNKRGVCQVAESVDGQAFFKHFFTVCKKRELYEQGSSTPPPDGDIG